MNISLNVSNNFKHGEKIFFQMSKNNEHKNDCAARSGKRNEYSAAF